MQFEHLVEINDLPNPLILIISRAQLWRGLVLRAETPKLFIDYLDSADISARTEQGMQRSLRYGELTVVDTVVLTPQLEVRYLVAAQGEIPASSLHMRIEEPQPDALFVRFTYADGASAEQDAENELYNEYRRSAYQEADIDTVRIIRELAEIGRLDGLVN